MMLKLLVLALFAACAAAELGCRLKDEHIKYRNRVCGGKLEMGTLLACWEKLPQDVRNSVKTCIHRVYDNSEKNILNAFCHNCFATKKMSRCIDRYPKIKECLPKTNEELKIFRGVTTAEDNEVLRNSTEILSINKNDVKTTTITRQKLYF